MKIFIQEVVFNKQELRSWKRNQKNLAKDRVVGTRLKRTYNPEQDRAYRLLEKQRHVGPSSKERILEARKDRRASKATLRSYTS